MDQLCSLDARRPGILRARAVSSPYIFSGLLKMRSLRRDCNYCFGMFSEATRRALPLLVALQPRAWCVRKYSSDCEAQSRRATSLGLAGKSSSAAHCRVHAGSLRSGAAARSRLASWLKDLRSLFSAEAVTVRAEIAKHAQKIVLMPDGRTYISSGTWDLLTWQHGWCRGPDSIRPRIRICFTPCPQWARTNQQTTFTHHAQNPFSVYVQLFFPLHPPRDAAITVGSFLTARCNDLFIVAAIRSAALWTLPVIQTGAADHQRVGHQRRGVTLPD